MGVATKSVAMKPGRRLNCSLHAQVPRVAESPGKGVHVCDIFWPGFANRGESWTLPENSYVARIPGNYASVRDQKLLLSRTKRNKQ